MSDPTFAQFFPQSAAFEPSAYHNKLDTAAAAPTVALDSSENQKQPFDFFNYSQSDVVAPHPDQFELELDNSLAAFDAELSLLPIDIDTTDFSFYRAATPTFGPPSTFTVSTESVSAYESSVYNDNLSSRSESYYNYSGQSPTSNYPSSVYSLTQEQLDMEFQRMAMPTEDVNSFGALPSPSMRSSPGSVPNISQYSPPYPSPRGSFSDYEPAQPQQVRLGSSAASDYYPQAQVQINKYTGVRVMQQAPQARSTASLSPQMSALSHPSAGTHPSLTAHRAKMDNMQDDPKRKYQCPTCPRAFARAYNLKTHIQTHDPNRLKPYACHHKSCGRSFSRKHDLTRHMVSIHRAESVTALSANSPRSIGVDSGRRAWCEQCGRSWVGKGKEKGCECDDVK